MRSDYFKNTAYVRKTAVSSSIQKLDKKDDELAFAKFFIERLNQFRKLNYRVVSSDEESSGADIYATAENLETLNLQLKTGEPGLERFWGRRRKLGSGMGIIDVNIEDLLAQIIRDSEKHYANKENLTLLITERYQPVFDKNYALRISTMFGNSSFKGIYIVKLPSFRASFPYEGQIVAIKDIFGNHGEVF
ncbi:MAG: hypothetical protein HY473_01260 [Candidatus Sungbacteria bacterium]|uniref:Uncharacterized protein n=1 Tax=Candidatus Sungiibacteriota bacterium TaxID=2750080 RepID=A0A932YYU4_9BACT|nr:hypothetical protein [Candidatus Sungbacteria bacterium]